MALILVLSLVIMLFIPAPVMASDSFSDVSTGIDYGGVQFNNSSSAYWVNHWENIDSDYSYFRACNFIAKIGNTYYYGVRYFSDAYYEGYRYESNAPLTTSDVYAIVYPKTELHAAYFGYSRFYTTTSASPYYQFKNSFPCLDLRPLGSLENLNQVFSALADIVLADIPVEQYGRPVASYSVNVAGSGAASVNNSDTISWADYDSLNNELPYNAYISIRVIPGTYEADSQANIFKKTYQDFKLDTLHIHDLGTFPASSGSVSFTWGEIIDNLDNFVDNFNIPKLAAPWVENGIWQLWGWSYEVRLEVGPYSSDWITIYAATSSGVENSQAIINSTDYNYEVFNALTDITTINNDNSITYNIYGNNVVINNSGTNSSSDNGSGGKQTNFWDFLISAFGGFFDTIKSAIHDLGDLVSDLFGGLPDILGNLFSGLFNFNGFDDIQNDVEENTGMFGESVGVVEDIKDELENAPSDSVAPVFSYPGITIDNIQIIPPVELDFSVIYDSEGLGLDQSLVFGFTDAFIYFSLFVLVFRKIKEFLR